MTWREWAMLAALVALIVVDEWMRKNVTGRWPWEKRGRDE